MKTHLTMPKPGKHNSKTGPIPVSTSSAHTCWDGCQFKDNGCYAGSGPINIHWAKVTSGERGFDWPEFIAAIAALPAGQLWRHNQAGDLPGINGQIAPGLLRDLTNANTGKKGFTYTHKPVLGVSGIARQNREAIETANARGFVINLSGNTLAHADELADLGIGPVVVVVPSTTTANTTTPAGRKVVICPATQRDDVTCATCKLCARGDRSVIVGFPSHGTGKKKADTVANS